MHLVDDARYQHGVFSRRQALDSGLTVRQIKRRLTTQAWSEPANNVYADAGLTMTDLAWQWAALLSCGARAMLSHRSAADVWGMPVPRPPRPEVSLPVSAHARPGPHVTVHRVTVPTRDFVGIRGLRVTSRQRTVLDCLLILPENEGRTLLDRALQRRWVQLSDLGTAIRGAKGRNGAARARRVAAGADPTIASEGERLAKKLLLKGGVTGFVTGHPLLVGGRVIAYLDIAFLDVLLAIEINGFAWHTEVERFQGDRRRQNILVAAGWSVLRFTWADLVERPAQVLADVVATLARLRGESYGQKRPLDGRF